MGWEHGARERCVFPQRGSLRLEEPGDRHAWKRQFADSIKRFQPVNLTQFTKFWVLTGLEDWRVYDNHEPWQIEEGHLSRVQCAYHTYFAIPPYDVCSMASPYNPRRTDKPRLPRYFTVPLWPDLRMALARFRLSAHDLRVVRGRYAGEEYPVRICALTGDENCFAVQDEMHMVLECQHSALSALRVHFEELFAVKARGNTPAHGLHLFMNHRNVISVAKFVHVHAKLDGFFIILFSFGGTYRKSSTLKDFLIGIFVLFFWL